MYKYLKLFVLTAMINACNTFKGVVNQADYKPNFGVVYSNVDVSEVEGYDLLIVEPYYFDKEKVQELHQKGTKVIAYISLGEVNPSRNYFEEFKALGFRGRNDDHGSYYIDLANKTVQDTFINNIIPSYIALGFDGLFLDTIDAVAPYSERKDQQENMVQLIKSIRETNPDKTIIQNAGFFLLSETKNYVDAVAIENVATGYNFQLQQYIIYDDAFTSDRIDLVNSLSKAHNLPVLVIDFAENLSNELIIRNKLKELNHPLFISNIGFVGLPEFRITSSIREE